MKELFKGLPMSEFEFAIGINQMIAGYLYRDGKIVEIPDLLRQIANDYEEQIAAEVLKDSPLA